VSLHQVLVLLVNLRVLQFDSSYNYHHDIPRTLIAYIPHPTPKMLSLFSSGAGGGPPSSGISVLSSDDGGYFSSGNKNSGNNSPKNSKWRFMFKTLQLTSITWLGWFLYQVSLHGKAAADDVVFRATAVSSAATIFGKEQWRACLAGWTVLEKLFRLLAPFFHDIIKVLASVWTKLPTEVQLGAIGGGMVLYMLMSFRWARQMAFLPCAGMLM
jgi:hypothetical protein